MFSLNYSQILLCIDVTHHMLFFSYPIPNYINVHGYLWPLCFIQEAVRLHVVSSISEMLSKLNGKLENVQNKLRQTLDGASGQSNDVDSSNLSQFNLSHFNLSQFNLSQFSDDISWMVRFAVVKVLIDVKYPEGISEVFYRILTFLHDVEVCFWLFMSLFCRWFVWFASTIIIWSEIGWSEYYDQK